MDSQTPASRDAERSLAASIAVEMSWANTTDRTARTAPARQAADARFLAEADGDPVRAEHLRRAHYKRLALKSVQARRRAQEAKQAARDLASGGSGTRTA